MVVTVYSMTHCSGCKQVKKLLQELGIPFQERLVDQDPEALAFLRERNVTGVPYTVIGTAEVYGMRPVQIKEALRMAGLISETE